MRPKFGILGGGYVGLREAVGWAEQGYKVILIESEAMRFHELVEGDFISSEQELIEIFQRLRKQGKLEITQDLSILSNIDYVMVCMETDLASLWATVEQMAAYLLDHAAVIIKNTVPVGTADLVQDWFKQKYQPIEVISYPHFFREGKTIEDIRNPSRIILGGDADHPRMTNLRRILAKHHSPILVTTRKNAEMIKYAAHAFLATKTSFINEIARVCEGFGLDVQTIAQGIGMDPHIGQAFLKAGIGFEGPSLPNDLSSLINQAREHHIEVPLLDAVGRVNQQQKEWVLTKLKENFDTIEGKRMGIWAVIHHSDVLSLIEKLQGYGAALQIYDPFRTTTEGNFRGKLCLHPLEAVEHADVLLILTDWQEFKEVDLFDVKKRLQSPLVIDGRNLYPPDLMKELGFQYVSVGRKV